jgi:hypothetical protein
MSHPLLGFLGLTNSRSLKMNKAERKRRAAERKKKMKEARRAKRGEANSRPPGDEAPATQDAGWAPATQAAGGAPAPRPQRSMPEVHSLEDEVHMSHAKMYRAEAEVIEAGTARMLGDDEAIAMLTRAARSLDDVIQYVESVLKRLPAEQVAEAIAIADEPRHTGEKSRRGSNPAVQLLNIRLRAKNLMLRVMKILKPDLAKQMATA